jgi:hypothetical protein
MIQIIMLIKKRIHFIELEDHSWCPKIIRNLATDYLCFVTGALDLYAPLQEEISQVLHQNDQKVLDLCSGGGGPWPSLFAKLQKNLPKLQVTLSDFYPNIDAFKLIHAQNKNIDYIDQSLCAMSSCEVKGVRTLFLSSHHFRPDDLQKILSAAVNDNCPILFIETQKRNIYHLLLFIFNPLLCLLLTPFIKPLSLARLFFTYIIPAVPFIVLWDGLVSVLRTHTGPELINIANMADPQKKFDWRFIEKNNYLTTTTCFIGSPLNKMN